MVKTTTYAIIIVSLTVWLSSCTTTKHSSSNYAAAFVDTAHKTTKAVTENVTKDTSSVVHTDSSQDIYTSYHEGTTISVTLDTSDIITAYNKTRKDAKEAYTVGVVYTDSGALVTSNVPIKKVTVQHEQDEQDSQRRHVIYDSLYKVHTDAQTTKIKVDSTGGKSSLKTGSNQEDKKTTITSLWWLWVLIGIAVVIAILWRMYGTPVENAVESILPYHSPKDKT